MTLFGQIQVRSSGRRVRIERVGACSGGSGRATGKSKQCTVSLEAKPLRGSESGRQTKKNPPVGGLVAM